MPKFIIKWDCGYGQNHQIVEADTQDAADKIAYDAWREDAESNSDYSAEPYTKEEAVDLGLEDDDTE